jgi:hypothetical protein
LRKLLHIEEVRTFQVPGEFLVISPEGIHVDDGSSVRCRRVPCRRP